MRRLIKNWNRKNAGYGHGVRARHARNEGRVRKLQKMREAHRQRRERPGIVRLETQETERSGMLVVEAENVQFQLW